MGLAGGHAVLILYGSLRMRNGRLKTQLIGGVLLMVTVLAAFLQPCCSYYYLGPLWLPLVGYLVYSDTKMRVAIRQEAWQRAADYTRRTARLLPLAMYEDAASSYEVIHQLNQNQLAAAMAILNRYQPVTAYFKDWFDLYKELLSGKFRQVIHKASHTGTRLPEEHRLSYRMLAFLFRNDLIGFMDDFVKVRKNLRRFPRPFQLRTFFYLTALLGRPDLIQQAKAAYDTADTPSNWHLLLGIAHYNAGDEETAAQSFQLAASLGDGAYHHYVNEIFDAIQADTRPALTAEQEQTINEIIKEWELELERR
jgi:hypothetical protein